MTYYAVNRGRGPAWDTTRPMHEQAEWAAHAAFMNRLAGEGFVVLGGPLGDGQTTLLIIEACEEAEIHDRLADDPWTRVGMLRVISVQPWRLLLGDGLGAAGP